MQKFDEQPSKLDEAITSILLSDPDGVETLGQLITGQVSGEEGEAKLQEVVMGEESTDSVTTVEPE